MLNIPKSGEKQSEKISKFLHKVEWSTPTYMSDWKYWKTKILKTKITYHVQENPINNLSETEETWRQWHDNMQSALQEKRTVNQESSNKTIQKWRENEDILTF